MISKEQLNQMNYHLSGKTVIVTGGTAGIGRSTAEYLLAQGCQVVIAGRRNNADEIAREIETAACGAVAEPRRCIGIAGDICDAAYRKNLVETALAAFGKIDALVNSAGINILANAEDVQEEDWDKVLAVDLKASFFMAQEVGKYMIAQNAPGSIVNITSQAGIVALDRHVAYCAAKAGLTAMTEVLALEWGKYGIRINAVAPTIVLTELGHAAWDGPVGDAFKENMPSRRFAEPEEIAAVIAFLISDAAGMITGHNLVVDGGFTIQ
ncbi:MAG: D-threitol dehydrogenase [Ruminococcaceae bacterium]|nr:D-threitol dehydrogenase [Oscillospiraceae bacterium]